MIHLPISDLSSVDVVFGTDSPFVPPSPPTLPTIPGGMRRFSRFMYRDKIGIRRVVPQDVEGAKVAFYPLPTEALEYASVQSDRVERIEPGSDRVTVSYVHTVYTPTNRSLKADDQIEWIDGSGAYHLLTVIAPSIPRGVGDIAYLTQCVEIA